MGVQFRASFEALAGSPGRVGLALSAFGAAFLLRAWVWRRLLPNLPLGQALAGIHLALGGNHVLPLRMGEPLRVASVVRRAGVSLDAAGASTLTLRAADLVALVALGWVASPRVATAVIGPWTWPLLAALAALCAAGLFWLRRVIARGGIDVRMPGPAALGVTAAAWMLEAVLVWQAAAFAGITLDPIEALVVTATSVAAQLVAVLPGGIGTYEAAAVAGYTALGFPARSALVAAVTAHALKTIYSVVAGGIALWWPRPGFVGRLRLARAVRPRPSSAPDVEGPVVLVLPAHDEEVTIAEVIRRAPAAVHGRPVEVLVVDDGSTDGTAERAAGAGATVIALAVNQGLGAAVRTGLAAAVERGAAAVAFCDADGEYAPEEIDRLVGPILAGEADYVVGSRFAGGTRRMRPHRRLGNVVLTRVLSWVARRRVTDGQSGYRALSREAAARAEIVHDYNYAQVLTLDLFAKGFRYSEVPISYAFRQHGKSFVKLGRYLRAVVPAVYREINGDESVFDHVRAEPVTSPAPSALVEGAVAS